MNINVINHLKKFLPEEIIYFCIEPYTRKKQDKNVLEDIVNYNKTIKYIENKNLLRRYIIRSSHLDHMLWLIEGLNNMYMNKIKNLKLILYEEYCLMYSHKIEKLYNKILLKSDINYDDKMNICLKKYWKLLKPFQRVYIINFAIKDYLNTFITIPDWISYEEFEKLELD